MLPRRRQESPDREAGCGKVLPSCDCFVPFSWDFRCFAVGNKDGISVPRYNKPFKYKDLGGDTMQMNLVPKMPLNGVLLRGFSVSVAP